MDEKQLTEKQRGWLDESKKIGSGPMTKSEKNRLKDLYADMLPQEQRELYAYIQEHFGAKDGHDDDSSGASDPIAVMEQIEWREPSKELRGAFARAQTQKPPPSDD
ncbi:MAG: hypothetical protein V2B18_19665 [Pseudomonadota bacterium]